MTIADLGRTFRLAVPNKTAATTSPAKNAIKSTADCCVMQYLYSHQAPRADVRPSKKMAAAKRRARLPGLEQCRNALGLWSRISNALKKLGFRSHNFLAQLLSESMYNPGSTIKFRKALE